MVSIRITLVLVEVVVFDFDLLDFMSFWLTRETVVLIARLARLSFFD